MYGEDLGGGGGGEISLETRKVEIRTRKKFLAAGEACVDIIMFNTFYSILSVYTYLCYIELSTFPFIVWNSSNPKDKFAFHAFIMKFFCTV